MTSEEAVRRVQAAVERYLKVRQGAEALRVAKGQAEPQQGGSRPEAVPVPGPILGQGKR